ncbi:MAG: hypothetical protein JXA94_01835 [Parachlamydiales bacterium]|nr:hypothetical protein [Parachlamydiales bacterium]
MAFVRANPYVNPNFYDCNFDEITDFNPYEKTLILGEIFQAQKQGYQISNAIQLFFEEISAHEAPDSKREFDHDVCRSVFENGYLTQIIFQRVVQQM